MAFIAAFMGACGLVVRDTNNQLAESLALEQADQRLRGVFKASDDVFAELDPAVLDPCAHLGEEFAVATVLPAITSPTATGAA